LKRLRKRGELKLEGKFAVLKEDAAWEAFCDGLAAVDWVSFIQPPPPRRRRRFSSTCPASYPSATFS
jgi:hypothetical protein